MIKAISPDKFLPSRLRGPDTSPPLASYKEIPSMCDLPIGIYEVLQLPIRIYCQSLLHMDSIPKESRDHIPEEDLTIEKLLGLTLPKQDLTSPPETTSIETLFSMEPPGDEYKTTLENTPIPSPAYITKLKAAVKDAQESGYLSICGDSLPGTPSNSRYPFWSIQYWERLSDAIMSSHRWARSLRWLGSSKSAPEVKRYIQALPRIKPATTALVYRMDDLPVILSDGWLSDEHIGFFVAYFRSALSISSAILIVPLGFSMLLQLGILERVSVYA